MTKPVVPRRGRSALGSLLGSVPPENTEPAAPAVCGKPTMAQDAEGGWIPCGLPPGHDGDCR